MLTSLSIKNYALIDKLLVNFKSGFSIITGETGAGKSILLGGLGLILGKRADLSSLKNEHQKCIVEGEFAISNFDLEDFFEENQLDFEENTIIRREILPGGKSRAFINDSPTNLSVLAALGKQLVDVHSQHQTLQLADKNFQFLILDSLAGNTKLVETFKKGASIYKRLNLELEELKVKQQEATEQHDYNSFLLNELETAAFKTGERIFLEETLEKLNHIEDIKLHLQEAQNLAEADPMGLVEQLRRYSAILNKLGSYSKEYTELADRMSSLKIEFEDIARELESGLETVETSPEEIESYNNRLGLLLNLLKKHHASDEEELLEKQQILAVKVGVVENASSSIELKQAEIGEMEIHLNNIANKLSLNRKKAIPKFTRQLEEILKGLEMPNTSFKILLEPTGNFLANGKDALELLISTNKGASFEDLKKIASGGEMSRIMLAVKSILCSFSNLPTIIFDEIDTGVSGEVSNRIASVMEAMSGHMQVIAITHLPQIAAKGKHHYKVFKTEEAQKTLTNIKELNPAQRVEELAQMLSGKDIATTAIGHAKQLLKQ